MLLQSINRTDGRELDPNYRLLFYKGNSLYNIVFKCAVVKNDLSWVHGSEIFLYTDIRPFKNPYVHISTFGDFHHFIEDRTIFLHYFFVIKLNKIE